MAGNLSEKNSEPVNGNPPPAAKRSVSIALGVGIAAFPYVFSWFTLRRGHSTGSRFIAFSWLAFLVLYNAPLFNSTPRQVDSSSQAAPEATPDKKDLDPKLFKRLHRSEDKMEGLVFYSHPSFQQSYSRNSALSSYLVIKGNYVGLRLFVNYNGEDWLFVQSYKFLIDGERFEITVPTNRDLGSDGTIYEWSNSALTDEQEIVLRDIAASKNATIRYAGTQFYKDRKISASEKAALRQIFEVYDSQK